MICAQARVPGVSVSQVARRYDVNANQVFNWLKDPRCAARPEDGPEHGDAARFLPVEIVAAARPDATPAAAQGEIEIDLACGHRLRIIGSYDPEALARLIRGLSG
jgi:transposase